MKPPLLLIGLLLAGIGSSGGDGDRPEAGAPAATGPLAVGDVARPWQLAEWSGTKPLDLEGLRGRVVVVRFWTDACPYCTRSLPALQALAEEFRDRSVTVVGLYHAKPPGHERPWPAAVAWARRRGVSFPWPMTGAGRRCGPGGWRATTRRRPRPASSSTGAGESRTSTPAPSSTRRTTRPGPPGRDFRRSAAIRAPRSGVRPRSSAWASGTPSGRPLPSGRAKRRADLARGQGDDRVLRRRW